MLPLCQAAAQLGHLALGASHAGPVHAFGHNTHSLAGVAVENPGISYSVSIPDTRF